METVLKIEKVVHRGLGLGRLDGKVWLVPFTAPFDVIKVRAKEIKKGYIEGELLSILEPSPLRVEPKCPYYGRCGGCHLQHINERSQPDVKAQIVKEAFERAGLRDVEVSEIVSQSPWHYRHRASLHCANGVTGFYEMGSHKICEVSSCKICVPKINDAIQTLKETLKDVPRADVEVSVDAKAQVFIVLRTDFPGAKKVAQTLFAKGAGRCVVIEHPSGRRTKIGNPDLCLKTWDENGTEIEVVVFPTVFFQVNMRLNRTLVETVLKMLSPYCGKTVFEGYCGAGNFTVGLAKGGAKVVGVDTARDALEGLDEALKKLGLDADLIIGDVAQVAQDFAKNRRTFDLVLLDPPRQGVHKALKDIGKFGAQRIVMVSCEVSTLARDVRFLCGFGYKVKRVVAIDMFPQTFHVETVCLLEVV